jgi:UrcA family protein
MKTLIPLLLSGAVLASGPHAKAEVVERTASVSYADLDLSHVEGRATLAHRVDVAVRKVCRTTTGPLSLVVAARERSCEAQARAAARTQLVAIYARPILRADAR